MENQQQKKKTTLNESPTKKGTNNKILSMSSATAARLAKRKTEILKLQKQLDFLMSLQNEAITAFCETHQVDPKATLSLNEEEWTITIEN